MQKNTFLQNPSKVEFVKTPIVEQKTCQSIINNVNKLVRDQAEGRLFAVVHLCGKQYKVTAGDIVVIEGYWPPTTGDKIRLEKVKPHNTSNQSIKPNQALFILLPGVTSWRG